jgi:hypothetical protein
VFSNGLYRPAHGSCHRAHTGSFYNPHLFLLLHSFAIDLDRCDRRSAAR